jgi:putative ABC transport system permease protein
MELDLFKVALLNVGRNQRRSLITILTVFIGVIVSIGTRGLLNGLQGEIRSNLTRKLYGDLQIHRTGYQDSLESQPYKMLIPQMMKEVPWPTAPRLKVMGLLNHQKSQTTTPVVITGIDSRREQDVCPRFASAVQQGTMIDSSHEVMAEVVQDEELVEAKSLDDTLKDSTSSSSKITGRDDLKAESTGKKAEGFQQILLTPSLVRGLRAEIGDELVVLISDRDNMQQAIVARLVGVVDVGIPGAAARMAWMDLASLQKTLNIEGQASEIAIRLPEELEAPDAKKALDHRLGQGQDLVVETWSDLGGFLRDAMALQDIIFTAVVAIMFAIVISAIVNTSLMTVMERTREIGTLMALGYRRKHILQLFLTESGIIGGLGGIAGVVVGGILVLFLNLKGISIRLPGQVITTVIYPQISLSFVLMIFQLAVLSALVAGFIPAKRASHLKPVEALGAT